MLRQSFIRKSLWLWLPLIAAVGLMAGFATPASAAVPQVAAGSYHSVAVKSDGTVWTWGYNEHGQLGNNSTTNSSTPVTIAELANVTAVGAGEYHTVAVKNDGTVWAWGYNYFGQLGNDANVETGSPNPSPLQVPGLAGATAVAAGSYHSVALKNDGTVWAWGGNTTGQLGTDTNLGEFISNPTPVQVTGLAGVTAVAAGGFHNVVLKNDGTVWAWGDNAYGQLGNGNADHSSVPIQVPGLAGVIAVAAGQNHTVAVKGDGTVWTWGKNSYGQLGNGSAANSTTPVEVTGLTGVVAVAGGGYHTVAVKSDGTVWAWGNNSIGELGNGSDTSSTTPVQVTGLSLVAAVAAGELHTVTLSIDGTVRAWGYNEYGQLGNGSTDGSAVPVQVTGVSGVIAIAMGGSHTVAVKDDGSVRAWGDNLLSQLGNDTNLGEGIPNPTPLQVTGLAGVTSVAAGGYHTVALKNDGTVRAWGYNNYGQLGNGTTNRSIDAVQATGLAGATAVAAGSYHSAALKDDGTVWAWGYNGYGQLGNNSTTNSTIPVQVPGLTGVTAIAAGNLHTVAVKNDGTVWAWGVNSMGQLGNGVSNHSAVPLQVPGLTGVVAVGAGPYHTAAVKSDGTVWTWGYNYYGELGNNSRTNSTIPVQVTGLAGATAVAAGLYHTVAMKNDGTVWAWGYNNDGELGNNSTALSTTPVQVTGLTGVTAIASGQINSLAMKNDGTVYAWGDNYAGQLGFNPVLSPVQSLISVGERAIIINNGSTYTNNARVTLALTCPGAVSTQFSTSSGAKWTSWAAFAATATISLPSGAGLKTVSVRFKDGAGEIIGPYSATINLDTKKVTGTILINNGDKYTNSTSVALTLTATDAASGVADMQFSPDNSTWSDWQAFSGSKQYDIPSGDGTKKVYVRYRDNAGNISSSYHDSVILDTTPPTGTIKINKGTTTTASSTVTLNPSAKGAVQMQLSNNGVSWNDWQTYATKISNWNLEPGTGLKTVSVMYKDAAGNISAPVSASITVTP